MRKEDANMSFSYNASQQTSIFNSMTQLTEREKQKLNRSWAKTFSEKIFPAIDEKPFEVLYSDRPSRSNTPVNIIIGALILKEILGMTDEELVDSLSFDVRFQYALHTESFEEQPLNDRTFGRFRARCNTYEEQTGIDLIHDCIISLSSQMAEMMHLNSGLRRMDSLMVASNIKKMSRLELLYTCVANLVNVLYKAKDDKLPEQLSHYCNAEDHNETIYYNKSDETESKIEKVLKDAALLIHICGSRYDECSEYQLLMRVIREQTDTDQDGHYHLKADHSGMDSSILQNPADPDATYRKKSGKGYRGYTANVVEETDV